MSWTIQWADKAVRQLGKLDRQAQRNIVRYLKEKVAAQEDPRVFGKALMGDLMGLWRYRVGDYRVVCRLQQDRLIVMVVTVGHRKNVY